MDLSDLFRECISFTTIKVPSDICEFEISSLLLSVLFCKQLIDHDRSHCGTILAVQMPLRSHKWRTTTQAKVIILCLFLAAFTLNIPILFTARMTPVSCIAIAFKNTFSQVIEINLNIIPQVNDQFFHVRCNVGCNVGYQNRNIVQK